MDATLTNTWAGERWAWADNKTWVPRLAEWLAARTGRDLADDLRAAKSSRYAVDDPRWLSLLERLADTSYEWLCERLGEALEPSTIRAFHGCRTEDAGSYFREGIKLGDRAECDALAEQMLREDPRLAFHDRRSDHDMQHCDSDGRCYVVADDRFMLRVAGHYLINGSEWRQSIFGERGIQMMRERGAPTLLEIDLPLSLCGSHTREELARFMLREWARTTAKAPDSIIEIDFTFILDVPVPAECIIGHSHPAKIAYPHDRKNLYRSPLLTCAYCSGS